MIILLLSLIPFVVEVIKYKSFISNHLIISSVTLSDLLMVLGIFYYSRRPKNWLNYLFIPLYMIFTWLHLNLKYLDSSNYPNFVYSKYGIDWGPLGHVSQRLMLYFFITEYLKRYHYSVVSSLASWLEGIKNGYLIRKILLLIFLIISFGWLVETNKIVYNRQLEISEFIFLNPNRLDKQTYSRTKSIGNFYFQLSKWNNFIETDYTLIIPPQSDLWPYEGNMPLIRGIIYPNQVIRYEINKDFGGAKYILASCGHKFNNTGTCYPSENLLPTTPNHIFIIDNKGHISQKNNGNSSFLRDTENLMLISVD